MSARADGRRFYTGMAVVGLAVVFAGFGRTYYLKTFTGAGELPALVHVHGAAFTAWMVLFLAQARLIAVRRTSWHRRAGLAGGGLAASMVVLGVVTAVGAARRGHNPAVTADALGFLLFSLGDIAWFAVLAAAGLAFRRRPDVHRRLMLLATVGGLLPAAIARLPYVADRSTLVMGVFAALLAAGPIHDRLSTGRLHPVYKWLAPAVFVSVPLRIFVSGTAAWHRVAEWLTS